MINPLVWYSHNILPIKNDKLKPKSTWGPDDRFGCHDRQVLPWLPTWRIRRCPAKVGCSFSRYTNNSSFRYTNDEQIDHSLQRQQYINWTREDNKLALYCYFRSNLAKREYRKRMIEIWTDFFRFKATNQRLSDQDLEILEIHQQIYKQTHQQTSTTVTV